MRAVILGLVLLVCALASRPVSAEPRLALVIGNSAYPDVPLHNPLNDARDIAALLKRQGFEVILKENVTRTGIADAVQEFGRHLVQGGVGLFYYSGHGMQMQGRNFVIPVDAGISSEQAVRLQSLDLDAVLDQMQAARSRISLVILDACRNNPFEPRFRGGSGGLAQINAPEGTLIAYATAPGKVASDGDDGRNGLYTRELLKAMARPGLKVEDMFKQVRIAVSRATEGTQVPWEASSLTGDFVFNDEAPVVAPRPVPKLPLLPQETAVSTSVSPHEALFRGNIAYGRNNMSEALQWYILADESGVAPPMIQQRIRTLRVMLGR